jgi:hypothetical protein
LCAGAARPGEEKGGRRRLARSGGERLEFRDRDCVVLVGVCAGEGFDPAGRELREGQLAIAIGICRAGSPGLVSCRSGLAALRSRRRTKARAARAAAPTRTLPIEQRRPAQPPRASSSQQRRRTPTRTAKLKLARSAIPAHVAGQELGLAHLAVLVLVQFGEPDLLGGLASGLDLRLRSGLDLLWRGRAVLVAVELVEPDALAGVELGACQASVRVGVEL